MDTVDPVLMQLKKLRGGRGVSADRLAGSPAVLAALAMGDATEAYEAIRVMLRRMGDGERSRALKVDFGLDLESYSSAGPPVGNRTGWETGGPATPQSPAGTSRH